MGSADLEHTRAQENVSGVFCDISSGECIPSEHLLADAGAKGLRTLSRICPGLLSAALQSRLRPLVHVHPANMHLSNYHAPYQLSQKQGFSRTPKRRPYSKVRVCQRRSKGISRLYSIHGSLAGLRERQGDVSSACSHPWVPSSVIFLTTPSKKAAAAALSPCREANTRVAVKQRAFFHGPRRERSEGARSHIVS